MQIRYYFGESKLTEGERDYVEKRLNKFRELLDNDKEYAEDELFIDFRAEKDKKGFWNLEVIFDTPNNSYRASKSEKAVTEAFDLAQEAINKQIRRDKERWKDLKQRGGRSIRKKNTISDNARF
ncbi:MAG: HPF/RaiA family ribosome-associated protein [Candidatus Moranbacteria bacterium]|nr:HPF/RaiA family ribosome-associated protein [Candidatus Moranbacteria bacterium]